MQKKHLLIIAVSMCILFSLIKLTSLQIQHGQEIKLSQSLRFRFLIGVHALLLVALVAFYFLDDFYTCIAVTFFFFTIVAISFVICEAMINEQQLDHHKNKDFLKIRDNTRKSQAKTYLSMYYLTYIYSIVGSLMLGTFLLVRFLLIQWHQRLLTRQILAAVKVVPIEDELKGKECMICNVQFVAQSNKDLYEIKNCKHVFHSECLKEWVNYSRTCPLCRDNIFSERRSAGQLS